MSAQNQRNDHHRISPTAKLVAYWRAQSDIPYSKEIADSVRAEETARQILGERIGILTTLAAPHLEARYKSINRGLRREGLNNVLELAMGVSPRSLEYATSGQRGIYVGTDLPELLNESSDVLRRVATRHNISTKNIHLQPANVLEKEQLENAIEHFEGNPFGVCNEGLLMYLSRDEQAIMAGHIKNYLNEFGGSWVTPDISSLEQMEQSLSRYPTEIRQIAESVILGISNQTGRNIKDSYFPTEKEAEQFYTELGFSIEKFPFYDGNGLSTSELIPESLRPRILDSLLNRQAWILKPRK